MMSVNSTSDNSTLDAPHLSSNLLLHPPTLNCFKSRIGILILTAFSVTNILLLLPLTALVLFLGHQRWKRQSSVSSAAANSHSDHFTYHLVAMEMIVILASLAYCFGAYSDVEDLMKYGLQIFSTTWAVKVNFHSLTCVERYLAVVHPVTYLGLKNQGGVRIRNVSIGCVWLLCLVWAGLTILTSSMADMVLYFSFVSFALIVVCFCSLSVLRALRRPGPGEAGGRRVDQMKQRAFYTIVTIMAVLLLGLGGMLACDALEASELMSGVDRCALISSAVWFSLPSSLVLPLMFLHRAGKLPGCKRNTESG